MGLSPSARRRLLRAKSGRLPFSAVSPERQWSIASSGKVRAARCSCDTRWRWLRRPGTSIKERERTRRDLRSVLQNFLQCLPCLSVPAQVGAALGLYFQTPVASLVLREVHEVQRRMRLIGSEHGRRVKMSRVVVPVIQREVTFRVENGGLVKVSVEARPNERTEAPGQVWQEGRRGLGLL